MNMRDKRADRMTVRAERSVRLVGIGGAAARLGVTEGHLRMVVRGERPSARLLERVRLEFPGLLAECGE